MSVIQTRSFRAVQDATVANPDAVSAMIDNINAQMNTFLNTLAVSHVRDVQLQVVPAGKYDSMIVVLGCVTYVQ